MSVRNAFVLGYTGETGKSLVKELAKDAFFKRVVLVGRREVDLQVSNEDGKFVQKVVDFESIDKHRDVFTGCDVGFCCIGTTKAKAKTAENFVRVDRDYVVDTARIAKEAGCQHFQLVTSNGANKDSMLLYLKTKGETEELLKQLQFPKLTILRPAILLCKREERRVGERISRVLLTPLIKLFPTYASVPTEVLAQAMLATAKSPPAEPIETLENQLIHARAKTLTSD